MLWLLLRAVICSGGGCGCFASVFFALLLCLTGLLAAEQLFDVRQDTREADIHTLDYVGQLNVILAFFRLLLNVVARARIVRKLAEASEPIKHITDSNVECFAKYTIAALAVCEHLRVAAGHVEDCRVFRSSHDSAHLNVPNAMIYTYDRLVVHEGERASNKCTYGKRPTHAGSFRVTEHINVRGQVHFCLLQSHVHEFEDFTPVVLRSLFRHESFARRRDVGESWVGINVAVFVANSNSNLVCRALYSQRDYFLSDSRASARVSHLYTFHFN